MIRLKRSECAVLPLVLKKRWFDLVATGQKKEEYRDYTRYWIVRINNWFRKSEELGLPQVVEFRLGYDARAQRTAFMLECLLIRRPNSFLHPDWGEPCGEHYVIGLGERVVLEGGET